MKGIENFPSSSFDFLSTSGRINRDGTLPLGPLEGEGTDWVGNKVCVGVCRVCGVLCIFASRARASYEIVASDIIVFPRVNGMLGMWLVVGRRKVC